jgi:autoinducer 2-degrading protein
MITRLVKMTLRTDTTNIFLQIFSENKEYIAAFEGCERVELKRDIHSQNIFFTISQWRSEADLENYRKSELFKNVWSQTKILFEAKAEAWTLG